MGETSFQSYFSLSDAGEITTLYADSGSAKAASAAYTIYDALPRPSGDIYIDSLVWFGVPRWNYEIPNDGNTVYYMFLTEPLVYNHYGDPVINFTPFTDAQETATLYILSEASSLTGLTFVETDDRYSADIFFGNSDLAPYTLGMTYDYTDYQTDASGNLTYLERFDFVLLDNVEYANYTLSPEIGNYGYEILMHEIGHTLGLDDTAYTGTLPLQYDNTDYTVMSYNEGANGPQSTYQVLDVYALSYIYGSSSRAYAADASALNFAGSSTQAVFAQA